MSETSDVKKPSGSGAQPESSRNRNRGGRKPQQRSRFEGKIPELRDSVFDLQNKESDAFNLSLRNVAEYIARSIPNGGEFMQALNPDDLGFNALTPPADPPEKANFLASWELGKRTARTPTGQA